MDGAAWAAWRTHLLLGALKDDGYTGGAVMDAAAAAAPLGR